MENPTPRICPVDDRPVPYGGNGRRPTYCSVPCRRYAYYLTTNLAQIRVNAAIWRRIAGPRATKAMRASRADVEAMVALGVKLVERAARR